MTAAPPAANGVLHQRHISSTVVVVVVVVARARILLLLLLVLHTVMQQQQGCVTGALGCPQWHQQHQTLVHCSAQQQLHTLPH